MEIPWRVKDGEREEGGGEEDSLFPARMAGCLKWFIRMGERRSRQGIGCPAKIYLVTCWGL